MVKILKSKLCEEKLEELEQFCLEKERPKMSFDCLWVSEGLSSGKGFSWVLNGLEGRTKINRQKLQADRLQLNTSENLSQGALQRTPCDNRQCAGQAIQAEWDIILADL